MLLETKRHQNEQTAFSMLCFKMPTCSQKGPYYLLLNGDEDTFPILNQHKQQGTLIDVGAQAHKWGQPPKDYTCIANNTKVPSRRDYVYANPMAYNLIQHFQVDHEVRIPVHSILQLRLAIPEATYTVSTLRKNSHYSS